MGVKHSKPVRCSAAQDVAACVNGNLVAAHKAAPGKYLNPGEGLAEVSAVTVVITTVDKEGRAALTWPISAERSETLEVSDASTSEVVFHDAKQRIASGETARSSLFDAMFDDPPSVFHFEHNTSSIASEQSLNSLAQAFPAVPSSHLRSRSPSFSVKPQPAIRIGRRQDSDILWLAQAIHSSSPSSPSAGSSLKLTRRQTPKAPYDGDMQEEDVTRWTEHVRARRATRKAQMLEENEDVQIGTRVKEGHSNYVTAFVMLTGIRHSVSRVSAKLDRELTPEDFTARHKNAFNIAGYELTPSSKYDFKFKDYAPWVFRHLRQEFRIDPADYLVSLTAKYIVSELGSPGKSGSFFYYSRDYKYIIKTIHKSEAKVLRKILPAYCEHVKQYPNTLLSQFYGLHRVKLPYGRKIHFVVMNNLFPLHKDIHSRYDLKGSTIGRETLKEGVDVTYKDINWMKQNMKLQFGMDKKIPLLTQLEADVKFLETCNLMDYSLLVGIHDTARGNQEKLLNKTLKVFHPGGEESELSAGPQLSTKSSTQEAARHNRNLRDLVNRERPVPIGDISNIAQDTSRKGFFFYDDEGGFQSTNQYNEPDRQIYYLGIIDCLTEWSTAKKIEHKWKALKANAFQISPIKPLEYGERFMRFIHQQSINEEWAATTNTNTNTSATAGKTE